MARWQGFAVGFLGLTMLEVVVSSSAASSRAGSLAAGVGKLAGKVLSPIVPAFATPGGSSSGPTTNIGNAGGGPGQGGSKTGGQTTPGQQQQIQNGLGLGPALTPGINFQTPTAPGTFGA